MKVKPIYYLILLAYFQEMDRPDPSSWLYYYDMLHGFHKLHMERVGISIFD